MSDQAINVSTITVTKIFYRLLFWPDQFWSDFILYIFFKLANWLLYNQTPCASHAEIVNHYTLNPDLSIEKYFCLAVLCLVAACAILGNFYILICIVSYSALQRPGHLFLGRHSINMWTLFWPPSPSSGQLWIFYICTKVLFTHRYTW